MQSNLPINAEEESGPRCVNSPDVPEVDDPQVFAGLPCGDLRAYLTAIHAIEQSNLHTLTASLFLPLS
jgi:hypothetical protein